MRWLSEPCRKGFTEMFRLFVLCIFKKCSYTCFFDFWKFSIILFNFLINFLDSSSLCSQNSCKIRVYHCELPLNKTETRDWNSKVLLFWKKKILVQNSSFKLYWSCILPPNDYLVNSIKLTYINNYNKHYFYNFF